MNRRIVSSVRRINSLRALRNLWREDISQIRPVTQPLGTFIQTPITLAAQSRLREHTMSRSLITRWIGPIAGLPLEQRLIDLFNVRMVHRYSNGVFEHSKQVFACVFAIFVVFR